VIVLSVFVPGRFEDAQAYMGQLVAFGDERQPLCLELERFANGLEDRHPAWRGAATAAFARNDWLVSSQLRTLLKSRDTRMGFERTVRAAAETPLRLDEAPGFQDLGGFDAPAESSVLLDTLLYGNRLYLAADSGFYDYLVDWRWKEIVQTQKRLDLRCVSASAEFGSISVSCEGDGLFTSYDVFGWRGDERDSKPQKTAKRSLRTAWLQQTLVNYESAASATLLRAHVETIESDITPRPTRRQVLTELRETPQDLTFLLAALAQEQRVPEEDVQYVWNSHGSFFVNTYTHGFLTAVVNGAGAAGDADTVGGLSLGDVHVSRYDEISERVLSVHPTAVGAVVETDFKVLLFAEGKMTQLLGEEAISVRTFPGSKRFRHLVLITVDSGIYILGLVPETLFAASA
jgi:hypothetical protein